MQTKREKISEFVGWNPALDWLPIAVMIGAVSVALIPLSRVKAAELQGKDLVVIEGNDGVLRWEIPIRLDAKVSQPASVRFELRPHSAQRESDFQPRTGQLVFVPESLDPGLSRPDESDDPFVRQLRLEDGFGLDELAEVDNPVGLAFAPQGSRFGEALYAGSLDYTGIGVSDYVVRIDSQGQVEDLARLLPEADPTSLEFPPAGSRYGDFLFVSANNRDGQRAGDQGGTIQRIDLEGNVVDFTAIGIPLGPGEPGELAFGGDSAFGDTLLLANSVGTPADIVAVTPSGALLPLVDDGLFESHNAGLAPRSMAIDLVGNYGGVAYFGEFGRRCSCLRKLYPEGRVELWVDSLPGDPHSIVFAPQGVFDGQMFVAVDDGSSGQILRIAPDGTITPFLSGLQGFLNGNGKDLIEFSADGSVMYVADFFADRIYRVAPDTTLFVEIIGDRLAEPDETFEVTFFDPVNLTLPRETLTVTIENDDENDLPPTLVADATIELIEDGGAVDWRFVVADDVTPVADLKVRFESQVGSNIVVGLPGTRPVEDGLWVSLTPTPDYFGDERLLLRVEDEVGNVTNQSITVLVRPENDPPTLDSIPNVLIPVGADSVTIPLTGISTGAVNESDPLQIEAVIENQTGDSLLAVEYESPSSTGRLFLPPWSEGQVSEPVVIAVHVRDGGAENGEVTQRFRVQYEAPVVSVDLPPTVQITSPMNRKVVSTDLGTLPATATVAITVHAMDDKAISRVELFANDRILADFDSESFQFDWEGVPVGDYAFKAVAYDALGQSGESETVFVGVGERLGQVAIVHDHDETEIEQITDYLFEMGLESVQFTVDEIELDLLAPYDLVVWHTTRSSAPRLSGVQEVARAQATGKPFYFIGAASRVPEDRLPSDELDRWVQSTGFRFTAESLAVEAVVQELVDDSDNEILGGGFGLAAGKALSVSGMGASGLSRNGRVLAFAGDQPSMAMFPDPLAPDLDPFSRVVHQTFWVRLESGDPTQRTLKGLFQNSVCWLLRCPDCHAVDLALSQETTVSALAVEDPFTYRVLVRHSGECDASGVVLRVPVPTGLEVIDYDVDHGRVLLAENELFFSIGRLARAAEVNLEWRLRPYRVGQYEVVATLSANQVEVNSGNNKIQWEASATAVSASHLSIRSQPGGDVELRIDAEEAAGYELQESRDLIQWKSLGPAEAGRWIPFQMSDSIAARFYRALRKSQN